MIHDELVRRRVEVKHLVPASAAAELRKRISAARPGRGARRIDGWVTTAYFDLADRRLARAALERPEANLKLRLREYFTEDAVPCSPFVWFEIKEREGGVTRKSRFQLHRRMIRRFLDGDRDLAEILSCQEKGTPLEDVVSAVQRIDDLARSPLLAVGAVRYRRTSVQGGDPAARVTLDEKISYHLGLPALSEGRRALDRACLGPAAWEEGAAIVEVKHSGDAPPAWCDGIVGAAAPAEYSKFLVLARLSLAEVSAA
jgi:hypothetical protein